MKVLWLTSDFPGYTETQNNYNGRGWIKSLLDEFSKDETIELSVAFYSNQFSKYKKNGAVLFIPLFNGKVKLHNKIFNRIFPKRGRRNILNENLKLVKKAIDIFKPDVIHVWGTESDLGLVTTITNVPVVIHLQGLINPYKNAILPPGFSKYDFILQNGFTKIFWNILRLNDWEYRTGQEIEVLKNCKYLTGRTDWDRLVSKLYSPTAKYLYCSEMLRSEFYSSEIWVKPTNKKYVISSTISPPLYKGFDFVLKTASILKNTMNIDFEWNIYGANDFNYVEKKLNIKSALVNVNLKGTVDAQQLKDCLLSCDVYVHPSYIDNSPNSVCEAQILGVPVVAVNCGGVSSIITHMENGILIPSNEPHILAAHINLLLNDAKLTDLISHNAHKIASERHMPKKITNNLIEIYKEMING